MGAAFEDAPDYTIDTMYGRRERDTRWYFNQRDRNPNTRQVNNYRREQRWKKHTMSSSDSSSFSSFFSSFSSAAAAGAPPTAGAAGAPTGAPPPEPTFKRSSFTFFPSRALARRLAQIGSSSTPAAFVIARIFSDYRNSQIQLPDEFILTYSDFNTVISEDEGSICSSEFRRGLISKIAESVNLMVIQIYKQPSSPKCDTIIEHASERDGERHYRNNSLTIWTERVGGMARTVNCSCGVVVVYHGAHRILIMWRNVTRCHSTSWNGGA